MAAAVALEIPRRVSELVDYQIFGGGDGWPDDGCDLAPKCLSCPFPKCRYDYPGGGGMQADINRVKAQALRAEGRTLASIARELGVSLRTANRLAKAR